MFIQMYKERYMRFPQGKCKAVTFSYDDGVDADLKLIKIFDKYGMKGTFNINSELFGCKEWHGQMTEEQAYKALKDSPHEVAIHGARHVFLDKVPLTVAVGEILHNREYLEKKFGKIVRGMAYAYNSYSDEVISVLKPLGVQYARTTESSYTFDIPDNPYKLKPTCHHKEAELEGLADKFINSSPAGVKKHREPWLFYIWGHSFEFDDMGNWHIIEGLCKRLSACNDIWFATNGEIFGYIEAYNSLIYSADGERVFNPSYMPVYVEIRGKVYEILPGQAVKFGGV